MITRLHDYMITVIFVCAYVGARICECMYKCVYMCVWGVWSVWVCVRKVTVFAICGIVIAKTTRCESQVKRIKHIFGEKKHISNFLMIFLLLIS